MLACPVTLQRVLTLDPVMCTINGIPGALVLAHVFPFGVRCRVKWVFVGSADETVLITGAIGKQRNGQDLVDVYVSFYDDV